jgi:hypothetical protein
MVWWEGTAEIPGRIVELTDSMGASAGPQLADLATWKAARR